MAKQKKVRKAPASKSQRPDVIPGGAGSARWWIPFVAGLLIIAAYGSGIRGAFVYDDQKQIVENHLIQENRYFWKALSEDVWAFKGERKEAWSNYWRPAFILWLIINHRLFGLNPAGWHVMNIILHAGVCFLLWGIMRRLRITEGVQAAVLWVFAVHPVHVESVGWISGSTDLLLGIFLAASLYSYLVGRQEKRRLLWLSYLLYIPALLSKEAAVLFPGVIFACSVAVPGDAKTSALRQSIPYVAAALAFLLIRSIVLSGVSLVSPWAPDYLSTALSVPLLCAFYLYLCFVPLSLGPSYGIRAVTPATLGFMNFVLPLAVLAGFAFLAVKWIRGKQGGVAVLGLAVFGLLLLPALYIRAFLPDQLAHDRYLYLPLFGLLLMLSSALPESLSFRSLATGAMLLAVPLIGLTLDYNRAYRDELSFWQRAVNADPNSVTSWSSLGNLLRTEGRTQEAETALRKALQIDQSNTLANYSMAMIDMENGREADAEAGLARIVSIMPEHESATDQLAQLYNKQNRMTELVTLLENARKAMPYRYVKYTQNLAFAYYRMGQADRALSELESVQGRLAAENDPETLVCWYYLADLYRAKGRKEDAVRAAQKYLDATSGLDPRAVRLKKEAQDLIHELQPK